MCKTNFPNFCLLKVWVGFFFKKKVRGIWSFYIQNQFLFELFKQHQLIRITFKQVYPNTDQFTLNWLFIKINSIKINSRRRHTKHTHSQVQILAGRGRISTINLFGEWMLTDKINTRKYNWKNNILVYL